MSEFAIEIKNVEKKYASKTKPIQALNNISLNIPKGSIFGLLGPNGAGKSTLINIIAGNILKNSGQIKINTHDIDTELREAKLSVGVVAQELSFDPYFTPEQSLEIQAGLYGIKSKDRKILDLLDFVGLKDKAKDASRSLSGGMKRRLMVAKAMVHSPKILILDEPTAGVDIELRKSLWKNIRALNQKGITIILTTHYLEEAEEMCDHIAIIDHGKIVANEKTEILMKRLNQNHIEIQLNQPPSPTLFKTSHLDVEIKSNSLHLNYSTDTKDLQNLFAIVIQNGYEIQDIISSKANLEEVFLSIIHQQKSF